MTKRIQAIDFFRGLTIILMILVNSPGNSEPYYFLDHSPWHGCTLADVVFPFFLFIVGLSIAVSPPSAFLKILKRSMLLFLIGVLLNAFPHHFDLETLRIYGVLQRIALCYFFSTIIFLHTSKRTQLFIVVFILYGYYLLMMAFPHSHDFMQNISATTDQAIFSSGHLYGKTFDPEGLLSTLPAITTTLLGCLCGSWLVSEKRFKLEMIFIAGLILLSGGFIWQPFFPINKTLWTSSYVLYTAGLACFVLGGCLLFEKTTSKYWKIPKHILVVFGRNAILAFILHVLGLKIQAMIQINAGPHTTNHTLKMAITEYLFSWASPQNAALFYAIMYIVFWYFVLAFCYQKKIFVKI